MTTYLLTHSKYFFFKSQKGEKSKANSISNGAGNVKNILKGKKCLCRNKNCLNNLILNFPDF